MLFRIRNTFKLAFELVLWIVDIIFYAHFVKNIIYNEPQKLRIVKFEKKTQTRKLKFQ